MKSLLLYLLGLAGCVALSAQLGMADRQHAAAPALNSYRESPVPDDSYREAARRREVLRAARSLLPLTAPRLAPAAPASAAPAGEVRPLAGEIVVLPIGNLPPERLAAVRHIADALAAFYALPARAALPVSLDAVPEACFVNRGGVWLLDPEALLDAVADSLPDAQAAAVVAVSEFRLDGAPSGCAVRALAPGRAAAALTLPRENDGESIRSTLKIAIHSLNKGFGAADCQDDPA